MWKTFFLRSRLSDMNKKKDILSIFFSRSSLLFKFFYSLAWVEAAAADSLRMLFIKYMDNEGNYGFFIFPLLFTRLLREFLSTSVWEWWVGRNSTWESKWIDNIITSHSHVNRLNHWMNQLTNVACVCVRRPQFYSSCVYIKNIFQHAYEREATML